MSQPRRRRRKRRKPSDGQKQRPEGQQVREQASQLDSGRSSSGRSRNRRRRKRGDGQISSPKSSEDLVRALPRERPAVLTAPPDGQSLETIIGELQSNYGVPAYPQEYRITIKVAEEKSSGGGGGGGNGSGSRAPAPPPAEGAPKREKAPAAPRVSGDGASDADPGEEKPARKRRSRRRRGRGGRSGGSGPPGGGASSAPPPPPPPPAS